MEGQEQLARRMERARRSDWEKLAAINTVVGDTKGAWQQRAEKALAKKARRSRLPWIWRQSANAGNRIS